MNLEVFPDGVTLKAIGSLVHTSLPAGEPGLLEGPGSVCGGVGGGRWGLQTGALHSEALSFAVDVAQTQVDVGADALHGLQGQGAPQVLGVGPGCGQAEAEAAGDTGDVGAAAAPGS